MTSISEVSFRTAIARQTGFSHFGLLRSSVASPRNSCQFSKKNLILVNKSSLYHVFASAVSSGETHTSLDEESKDVNSNLEEAKQLADEYSSTMQQAMGDAALIYRHELGMNYAFVLPDIIVGSCLQTPADAERLKSQANVGTVLCLQQDSDLAYFGLELAPVVEKVQSIDGMTHVRQEVRDFDPVSLRLNLPMAVAKLHAEMRRNGSIAYIHCTAGLGRAPAVALAYMFWLRGFQLNEANDLLQKVRRCSPKLGAIRAATCDLLTGFESESVTISFRHRGTAKTVEVAGLDVGWHNKLPLTHDVRDGRWTIVRDLPVGTYYFKFIVDGNWTLSPDAQITPPDQSGNINNYVDVVDGDMSAWAARKALMEDDGILSDENRTIIVKRLDEMADSLEA